MSLFEDSEPENEVEIIEHPCAICGIEAPWGVWDKTRLCTPHLANYDVDMGDRLAKLSPGELVELTRKWVMAKQAVNSKTEAA